VINLTSRSSLLLFGTARISAKNVNGGESVGTAFFFHFQLDVDRQVPVLVTNKHVIAGSETGEFLVHEGSKDADGRPVPGAGSIAVSLTDFERLWIGHPDDIDLCAMPFQPLREQALKRGKDIFYVPFVESLLPSGQTLENLSALEQVVMVGYPIGLWDAKNNLPLLRRGTTASHPSADFNGEPIGVVDMASFPGSSGSPILIFNEGSYATPKGLTVGTRIIFLGVLSAGPQFAADGTLQIAEIPTGEGPITRTNIPVHLGYYVKSKELITLKDHLFRTLNIK